MGVFFIIIKWWAWVRGPRRGWAFCPLCLAASYI